LINSSFPAFDDAGFTVSRIQSNVEYYPVSASKVDDFKNTILTNGFSITRSMEDMRKVMLLALQVEQKHTFLITTI
jgi:hypothetical protein